MPDYRVFKKSLLDTPQYGMLDIATQHLYMVLHLLADDQGRLLGHPAWVRSHAYPYQDIGLETLTQQMESLKQAGLIITYTAQGLPLIQITGWWDAQERMQWAMPSEYPPPDGWQDRVRYRANNTVLTQNWKTQQPSPPSVPQAPNPLAESLAPDELPSEPLAPGDTQVNSGKPTGEPLGKALGKGLGKGLGKDLGEGLPEPMRREEKRIREEKKRQEASPSPPSPEGGGPGGETTPSGGEGGGKTVSPQTKASTVPQKPPGNAPKAGEKRAARQRRTKHPPPDDPRVRLLHAAGITNGKVPKILAKDLALDDILAELARCYDPRSGVRRPEIIAPRHIVDGESPAATYRQPRAWQEHIPEAVLDAAGLGDWLEACIEQADRERVTELFPEEPGVQQRTPAAPRGGPVPSPHPPFDGPDEVLQAWQVATNMLQMDMPKAAFDTWVRPAFLLTYEAPNVVVVGAPSTYARDWLANRLATTLQRTLSGILDEDVRVRFVVPGEAGSEA